MAPVVTVLVRGANAERAPAAWALAACAIVLGGVTAFVLAERLRFTPAGRILGGCVPLIALEVSVLQHDDSLLDDNWLMRTASSLNRRRPT